MAWPLVAMLALAGLWSQTSPGAKALFYDPGDQGLLPVTQPAPALRPINWAAPSWYRGIHYWLETADGTAVTERAASTLAGPFTLHIRNNTGSGFLTVFEVNGWRRELTPRDDSRWSGFNIRDATYVVPSSFEFTSNAATATHLIIVWASSQTEVARDADSALVRVRRMTQWMDIVRESDETTPGEIGTYVVNRRGGGVFAEIVFRSRR